MASKRGTLPEDGMSTEMNREGALHSTTMGTIIKTRQKYSLKRENTD